MEQQPQVVAALVAAFASLLVALYSGVTARDAKRGALAAEESAKRSEQVRLHATEAGEKILSALGEMIIQAETVKFYFDRRQAGEWSREEILKLMEPFGRKIPEIRRSLLANAMYLSEDIREGIDTLCVTLSGRDIPLSDWNDVVSTVRGYHSRIAGMFRREYLHMDT